MIKFVLGKATFSPQYALSYFVNSEKLLGINETIDPLVFEYIQSYMGLLERVGVQIPEAEIVADDPNDVYAFVILPFTSENDWNDFLVSREMSKFMSAMNNLYPQVGWTFDGFKVIHTIEEPLVKTRYEIERIWNSN
jgi:hypothetical protein